MVKNLPAMQETWIRFLGPENPLQRKMAAHSSILAWGIPWTKEPAFSCLVVSNSRVTPWTIARQVLLSMEILQAGITEWVAMPSSRGSSQPRHRTQVSLTEADSLPSEPPGKPMNTGVGILSLLKISVMKSLLQLWNSMSSKCLKTIHFPNQVNMLALL